MDDLTGLSWNAKPSASSTTANKPLSGAQYRSTPSFPTPMSSGRSTPLSSSNNPFSNLQQPSKPPSKPSTPANDSFSNLLSLNPTKSASNTNLSLLERQKQLLEEKARQAALQQKQNAADSQFWDSLGGSHSTSNISSSGISPPPHFNSVSAPSLRQATNSPAEADLLASFRADATVDASSHFPPPKDDFLDDDDPFGLGSMPQRASNSVSPAPVISNDDDDILGMLGKPVSELPPRPRPAPASAPAPLPKARERLPLPEDDPEDKAVAELVDMGFPADLSAVALAQTPSGKDVQAAVSILLNQAHQEATQKAKSRQRSDQESPAFEDENSHRNESRSAHTRRDNRQESPAWMQEPSQRSGSKQRDGSSTSRGEKEVSQYASEIGNTLFKSANSIWKTGQKKVQKAMADFQQEGDSTQPKWMRDAHQSSYADSSRQRVDEKASRSRSEKDTQVTNEALLLEAGQGRPSRRQDLHQTPRTSSPLGPSQPQRQQDSSQPPYRQASPAWLQPGRPQAAGLEKTQATKLSRQEVEAQSAQAYISPARRKKMTPSPGPEPSLIGSAAPSSARSPPVASLQSNNPFNKPSSPASANTRTPPSVTSRVTPIPSRPKPPPRQVPSVSPAVLSASAKHRQLGTEAFKRGDYAAAQASYSSALSQIPDHHPIAIVILSNRALTNIKVGDPKAAIADADRALKTIGPSKGVDERIALGGADGEKDMREFFGKALMRKAEALENMEKWNDALSVWRDAVEAGVGGAVSMQGRTRCERAVNKANQPAVQKPAPRTKPAAPARSALQDLGGAPAVDSEAVKRMKAANAAAEKADNEKFALTDKVDARLVEWKGTKADNLRALLGSLDKVLWAEAGWNKVNMADLVMPNRVKIVYMKAIAKVHPDKLSQTATTEQKMISASVFATLNEAWDKFKKDNNL